MQPLGEAPFAFDFLIAMAWIGGFLLIGIIIRNTIPFMKKFLIPSCMLGGVAGVLILNLLNHFVPSGSTLLANEPILQSIAWHMYCILFLCIGLVAMIPKEKDAVASDVSTVKSSFWIAFVYGGATALQGFSAMLVLLVIATFTGTSMLISQGYLVGAAFAGGPGPAMGTGAVWQQAGHADMINIALGYAGIGFLLSLIVGVTTMNWLRHKTCKDGFECFTDDEINGVYPEGKGEIAGRLTFMSSNVDSLAFLISLVLFIYAIAYATMVLIKAFIPAQITAMLWGMFPVMCLFFVFPIGFLMRKVGLYKYIDRGLLTRIQGFLVDFMAVAALMGVNLVALRNHWAVMLTVSVCVIFVTMVYLYWQCRKIKNYGPEYLGVFTGWCTGTLTSGLVLLRMLDPELKTPVSLHVGVSQIVYSCISMAQIPFFMKIHHGEALYGWSYVPLLILLGCLLVVYIIASRLPILKMYGKEAKI